MLVAIQEMGEFDINAGGRTYSVVTAPNGAQGVFMVVKGDMPCKWIRKDQDGTWQEVDPDCMKIITIGYGDDLNELAENRGYC